MTGSNLLLSSGSGGGREAFQRGPPNGASAGSGKPVSPRVKQKTKEADAVIFSRLTLTGTEVLSLCCYFVLRWIVRVRGVIDRVTAHCMCVFLLCRCGKARTDTRAD